jgi:type IV pilus assembly protein PilY1
LGVPSGSEADLINWVRGKDIDNENLIAATPTSSAVNATKDEMRPSAHGGVVHSQPAVVDYGGTIGVVSFYGADDGIFHAVNGNKELTAGNEYWGFIAPETYTKLNRLKQNNILIKFPSVTTVAPDPAPQPKDYFFDGSIGVFQRSDITVNPIQSTVWIYPTMRRGGRAIYAFDVSTPTNPVLKWRKGCYTSDTTNDSNCAASSSGQTWSDIGQTWSKPQIAYLNGYIDSASKPKPVLVFGGGYDTCEDTDSQIRCTTTPRKGANIWFVDADTGNIIIKYPTNYSVPGDVTLLTDSNGYLTYAYAADTGGFIYRINAGTYNGSTFGTTWTNNALAANITIASMSEANQARKFLFGPDVIVYKGYNAVAIGSGDREHPLASSYACNNFNATAGSVLNQFYIVKDVVSAYPSTLITPTVLTDVTSTSNFDITAQEIGQAGLRFDLVNPETGVPRCEQTVNKSITIGGVTYFGTNAPKTTSEIGNTCGINLGTARGYAVNFLTGAPIALNSRSIIYKSGGLPPSPVGGVVDIDGQKQPFCIGCTTPDDTNPSPLQGSPVTIKPNGPRQRVYWYLEID